LACGVDDLLNESFESKKTVKDRPLLAAFVVSFFLVQIGAAAGVMVFFSDLMLQAIPKGSIMLVLVPLTLAIISICCFIVAIALPVLAFKRTNEEE
jgi:hypothetical protein